MQQRPSYSRLFALTALAGASLMAACGGSDEGPTSPPPGPAPVQVGDTIGLAASGRLISFNRAAPGTLVGSAPVSGLATGETLLGIDVRPADGRLYALGSAGNIYTIDPATGVATLKATLRAAAGDDLPYTALSGSDFGVDFNPVADRLRVVSNTRQNLRINVDTGDTITDGMITPTSGSATVTAAAYTNSFVGTTTTQLFDIDAASGMLHLQDPPNNGTLAAGKPLGVTGVAVNAFDIDARSNTGYAVLGTASAGTLYSVNLSTGAATSIGVVAGGEALKGIALMAPAAPSVIGLTTDNRLVAFDPKAPNTLTSNVAITGLGAGESVVGIDIRPADRALYALTGNGRVYTVDATTGAATLKSTLTADPADTTLPYAALVGTGFAVDFNPAADRLRVIGNTGQDLRINVDTGLTTTDGEINRVSAPAVVAAAAYTNSFAGTTTTVLYDLEANSDVLAQQNPPNNGTLLDIGPLGLDLAGAAGFDIGGGDNGLVLAALRVGASGPYTLYTISLTTGATSLYRNTSGDAALSRIGGANGPALRDITIRY